MITDGDPGSRAYRSAVRQDGAARTKRLITTAARDAFLADGYAATSVTAVARAAGVSGQTVYNVFGSKAALLKHVYDVTLVGDDDPVPFADRPEMRGLRAETDPRAFLAGYAAVGLVLLERLGPLLGVIRAGAAAGDPDLVAHVRTVDAERLTGVTMTIRRLAELGPLRSGLDPDHVRDILWSLNSVELWQLLVGHRGWSGEQYVRWVAETAAASLLPPPVEPRSPSPG